MDSLSQVSPPTSPGRGDYFHSKGGKVDRKSGVGPSPGLTSDSRPIVFTLRITPNFVQKRPHKCAAV